MISATTPLIEEIKILAERASTEREISDASAVTLQIKLVGEDV